MVSTLLAVVMGLTILIPPAGAAAEATKDFRSLRVLDVFKDKSPMGFVASEKGQLEAVNNLIPFDQSQKFQGLPSLRVNVTKPADGSWWMGFIAFRGWCTLDISQYVPNGYLEFNVKGKDGGEDILIGGRDKFERSPNGPENLETTKNIKDYVTITKEWQHVKIPLKDILDVSQGFNPVMTQGFVVKSANGNALTVWLNDMEITSPDREKGYPAIKVNQVGYLPNTEKYALVSGFADEMKATAGTGFEIRNTEDKSIVYTGQLTLVKDFDASSGERVLKADFSDLKTPGEYYMEVPGVDSSVRFKIGDSIFSPLLTDAARYFYYQRQGIELKAPYCTDYPREDKSPQDKNLPFASNPSRTKDVSGGWYDAGDRGKYVINTAGSLSDMLWAYETYPEVFKDSQFNIPESGNGVPDILDEARWALAWILKMQDDTSGGFYARAQGMTGDDSTDPNRFIKDKDEQGHVNIKTTDDTAEAAAILAHAYVVYKDIDKQFADQCLASAKRAWIFLGKNPNNIMTELKIYGGYNVKDDSSDRLWASASLFRATGETQYNDYFKKNYTKFEDKYNDVNSYTDSWGIHWMTPFFCYLKAEGKDASVQEWFQEHFAKWLSNTTNRYKQSPWENALKDGDYFWGCNGGILGITQTAVIGSKLLGTYNEDIAKMARAGLNWDLGINPLRRSFVSGYGEDCLTLTFSDLYLHDGRPGIPKGYLAGGPNAEQGKEISLFPAKCHSNSTGDWTTNENCINWNAALVFAAAFINSHDGKNN